MPPRRFTDEEEVCIVQTYEAGHSAKAIGRAYNLPGKDAVIGALRRANTRIRPNTEANRLYTINHEAFDVVAPESAYWWGFIYADGSVCRHKSLTVGLRHTDVDHVIALNEFLQSDAPVKIRDRWLKPHKGAYLHVTSQHMGARLEELGVLAHRPSVDLVIKNLPQKFTSHWLRGYFDGDGSVDYHKNKQPRIRFCGRLELVSWIRKTLADECARNPKLKFYKHATGLYYIGYSGTRSVAVIMEYMYRDATIFLERKLLKYKNVR